MSFTSSDHTFVVCAYKDSTYLRDCMHSVLSQTVKTRVLMATSTPTENMRRVADEFGLKLFVHEGGASGIAADWNFAVSCADTPLVTIAHQDDIYGARYAERMLAGVNSVKRPLIYFTNYGELRQGQTVDTNLILRVKRRMLSPLKDGKNTDKRSVRRRILSLGSAICCPSVTLNMGALPFPPFKDTFKCDLDWDAWERFSSLYGSFYYDSQILMYHRIHEESETTALISNNIRTKEDLQMLKRFWPAPIACAINVAYGTSQKSNQN